VHRSLSLLLYFVSISLFLYFVISSFQSEVRISLPTSYADCLSKASSNPTSIISGLSCMVTYDEKQDPNDYWDCFEYGNYKFSTPGDDQCVITYLNPNFKLPNNFADCQKLLPPNSPTIGLDTCQLTINPVGAFDRHLAEVYLNQCWKVTGYKEMQGQSCTLSFTKGSSL
jgi:hypothetical protein